MCVLGKLKAGTKYRLVKPCVAEYVRQICGDLHAVSTSGFDRLCFFIDKTRKAFQAIRSHEVFKQPRIRPHIFTRWPTKNITEEDPALQDFARLHLHAWQNGLSDYVRRIWDPRSVSYELFCILWCNTVSTDVVKSCGAISLLPHTPSWDGA